MGSPEKPLISIITCVYNGEEYLEKLIVSVQEQWDTDVEHLIIDDGSTDSTLEIIKKYPSVRWISRENRGLFASMNEGMENARGDFLCFIHSDDLIHPYTLQKVREAIWQNHSPDGVYGKILYVDEAEKPYDVQNFINRGGGWVYRYFRHISHCSLYIKKEYLVYNRIFFNDSLRCAADYEWFINVFQNKGRFVYVDAYFSQFRVHEKQVTQQYARQAENELNSLHKKYGVNPTLFEFFRRVTVIRNGFVRLYWEWRRHGLQGVIDRTHLILIRWHLLPGK